MRLSNKAIRKILTAVGVIGVGVTGWLSAKGSEKAKEKTDTKEKAKCYIPAIVSGVITTASIIGHDRLSSNEIAALTTTAAFAVSNRDKLQGFINEKLGKEAAVEAKKQLYPSESSMIEDTGRGSTKFLDAYSGRKFYSNLNSVKRGEEMISRRLNDGEFVNYNDLYFSWGIVRTEFGETHGWIPDDNFYEHDIYDDNPIGFHHDEGIDFDGSKLIVITIESEPKQYWSREDLSGATWGLAAPPNLEAARKGA